MNILGNSFLNNIGGELSLSSSGEEFEKYNPADKNQLIGKFQKSNIQDLEKAVLIGKIAFKTWKTTPAPQRAEILYKAAQITISEKEKLAEILTQETGKPLIEALGEIQEVIDTYLFFAGEGRRLYGMTGQSELHNKSIITIRQPIGICGLISAWNFPSAVPSWKIAPALITGNVVILKPSEKAPLSGYLLIENLYKAGLPKGCVSIIFGGGDLGKAMAEHDDIKVISLTGSTEIGKQVSAICGAKLKKCALELGGKNPVVIFDDCKMDLAIDWGLFAAFANSGQVCTAGSRILIQDTIYDEFVKQFVARAKNIKMGDGSNAENTMGPIVSQNHFDKVNAYIEVGKGEATLAFGGNADDSKGFFIEPTIFSNVTPNMRIAKEEIFGPVVALLKFSTEEEAIAMANDTEYGLGYGLFTQDVTRVHRVMPKIRAGIGWVNFYHPTFNEMPWGGYKQSGTGRELGLYGIEHYLDVKQVNINLDTDPVGWY